MWDTVADVQMIGWFGNTFAKYCAISAGCRGTRNGPSTDSNSSGRANGAISRRYACPSSPSAAAVAATDRDTITAVPSSSGCASGASGCTSSGSGNSRRNGEASASAWTVEQRSWT